MVDPHYFRTYGLELLAGRTFNEADQRIGSAPDSVRRNVVIINETAVRNLGFATPEAVLGKTLTLGMSVSPEVVGVARDFHTSSLHARLEARRKT